MTARNPRLNSSHLPHRYRRYPPLKAVLRTMDAEDTIVRQCADKPQELALACEIASESLRLYDEEIKYIPDGAWLYVVTESEREELQQLLDQQTRCPDLRLQAAEIVEELAQKVASDELFLAASRAASYFRARARR